MNVSVPAWTLCLAVCSLWPHTAGTHWVASCPCLYTLEHSNSTARVMEHFYFHFYFHPSFSQWATVSLSEVCSESQGWLGVGGGFAGEHRHCSVQSSHLTAPCHARSFWLWRALTCRGLSSCSLSSAQPCFFSARGGDECVSMVHPCLLLQAVLS